MSLIGGYFYKNGKPPARLISEKLESFAIIPSEDSRHYENVIAKGQFAHIGAKFKNNAPTQVRCNIGDKYALITLGFGNIAYKNNNTSTQQMHQKLSAVDAAEKIEQSEGEFTSLLLDKLSGDIHIINDRFASRPFYILQSNDAFFFSSNLAFLVYLYGRRLSPDPIGWLEIFSYGRTFDETTNFLDVRRLKPGSHIIISKDGITERQYWKLRHDAQYNLEPQSYAEKVFSAFESSVRSRLTFFNKGFVNLSGGLDSRLAAAAIPREADFYTFTIADSLGSEETIQLKTARQVSRILGREHRVVRIARDGVSKIADEVVRLTGGLLPIHHPCKSFQSILEMQRSSGFKMGGGAGDSLAGSYVSSSIYNIDENLTDFQVRSFILQSRRFSRKVLSKIFRRDVIGEYFPKLDEIIYDRFTGLAGTTAAQTISAWGMVYRQPAFTFTSPIHNHPDVTEAGPHLGYEYADLMLKLPPAWILQKNFYKFMIYHCLPDLRDVVYANTGVKLAGKVYDFKISNRNKICGNIEKFLPHGTMEYCRNVRRRPKQKVSKSFEYEMMKDDEGLFSAIRESLYSLQELKDFFNLDGCRLFLDDYQAGRVFSSSFAKDAELLGSLATACYWLKCVKELQ